MHSHDILVFVAGVLVGAILRGLFAGSAPTDSARPGVVVSQTMSPGLDSDQMTDQINDLIRQNRKIEAIKLYREQTGVGLKDAKDAVEDVARRLSR